MKIAKPRVPKKSNAVIATVPQRVSRERNKLNTMSSETFQSLAVFPEGLKSSKCDSHTVDNSRKSH